MEARNYAGAARLIREKNPFGEVCGLLCAVDRLCQKDCYRRDFTGKPVRIAELQRWVCSEAGTDGWLKSDPSTSGSKVAVMGGGPSALSCAYYLGLAGCEVKIFAPEDQPGSDLVKKSDSSPLLRAAVQNDLKGILSGGVSFEGGLQASEKANPDSLRKEYQAVYLEETVGEDFEIFETWLGADWKNSVDRQTGQVTSFPGVFVEIDPFRNGASVVEAAARGRRAALAISQYLERS
jgi:NADPH-dependent glutamate synthase beta subunit-like oxidoreductase